MTNRYMMIRTLRAALLATAMLGAVPALAQLSTATVRGIVTTDGTNPAPGTMVLARNVESGFVTRATVGADGGYALSGLQPGRYTITFTPAGGKAITRDVIVSVGQTDEIDVALSVAEQIIVTGGRRAVEVKTSEVATNVSTRQIENLPQGNRNFLNFTALAPGVKLNAVPNGGRTTFSGGGVSQDPNGENLGSPQVNVFIDGVSLKSNIQQGGLVGQDSTPGNPFPQSAVQEFRVLSGQFKAEYEDAGTTVVTAVTKSGGNEFHGTAFIDYTSDALRSNDFITNRLHLPKAPFEQKQYGGSFSGPIIKDKLNFFISYEGNDIDQSNTVTVNNPTPDNLARFGKYQGTFGAPFREKLGFAKLQWQPNPNDTIELSGSLRKETHIVSFGAGRSFDSSENIRNDIYTGNLKWQHTAGILFNEFTVDYLDSTFKTDANFPGTPGQNFFGVFIVGDPNNSQEVKQKGLTFRDNVTLRNIDFHGNHIFKGGLKVSLQDYSVFDQIHNIPVFNYNIDPANNEDFSQPFEAQLGTGNPLVKEKEVQVGVFLQDDWKVNQHLTFNLGVRWDVETNANNNNFVTPPNAVAALQTLGATLSAQPGNFFNPNDYISTGSNRKPYYGAFAPRVGFSYDLHGDQLTVIFGGWGRYFDRTLFRNAAEEELYRNQVVSTFEFSKDGLPRNGQPTVMFDPKYLTREGLIALAATSYGTNGELRVTRNDTRPPHTDQASIGVHQKIWKLNTSLTYTHIWGRDQIGYFPANRSTQFNAGGFYDYIPLINGFGNVVALSEARATNYDGIYVNVEKPYTSDSPWNVTLAYTMSFSTERGYAFNFDFPNIAKQPFYPNAGNERHRLVVSGLTDLPFGITGSTLITVGSGVPYQVIDATRGFGRNLVISNVGDTSYFAQVDARLAKTIKVRGVGVRFQAEVFNLFNKANFGGYDNFFGPGDTIKNNPNSLAGPPRTFQFGAHVSF